MCYTVLCSFQRNNGERASNGPCRAGFSQSFYSVLISRDVLRGQGVAKGKGAMSHFFYLLSKRSASWAKRLHLCPTARGIMRSSHISRLGTSHVNLEEECNTVKLNHVLKLIIWTVDGVNMNTLLVTHLILKPDTTFILTPLILFSHYYMYQCAH